MAQNRPISNTNEEGTARWENKYVSEQEHNGKGYSNKTYVI